MKKCEVIKDFYEDYNEHGYKNICLFTKVFKAKGEFLNEKKTEGVITIKNAKVYSFLTNCECEGSSEYKEIPWLNIFAEDIVAFSFKE